MAAKINCECSGTGFFYGYEIDGWKGHPHDQVACRECGKPSFTERMLNRMNGYKGNDQIIQKNFGSNGGQACDMEEGPCSCGACH